MFVIKQVLAISTLAISSFYLLYPRTCYANIAPFLIIPACIAMIVFCAVPNQPTNVVIWSVALLCWFPYLFLTMFEGFDYTACVNDQTPAQTLGAMIHVGCDEIVRQVRFARCNHGPLGIEVADCGTCAEQDDHID